jgi:hypothetical protein
MAYKQKKYSFPNCIEIEQYHTALYRAPGMKRLKKSKATPEQMAKANQRNKQKLCRRKLRAHFRKNDCYITLTYEKDKRPADMEQAKEDFRNFIEKVRKQYKKKGAALKWIRNIEVGSRGAWHVHMVINRIDGTEVIINEAWENGKVVSQLLYEDGEFRDLAAYMTKGPTTDPRLKETSYSTSRNLPLPEPEVKIYRRWKTWKTDIKIPDGYYLDPDSFHEGENPVTGYPYRTYTLVRIRKRE